MLAIRASARAVASMTSRIGKAFATPTLLDPAGVIGTYIVKENQKAKGKGQKSKVASDQAGGHTFAFCLLIFLSSGFHAIPAVALGSVESGVGGANQRIGALRIRRGGRGHAQAAGGGMPAFRGVEGAFAEQRAESLAVPDAGFQIAARQQDQEFLAAVPPYGIVGPQRRRDAPRKLSQHGVSRHMSEGVVQILEVVDIDHDDGELSAFP